MLRSPLWSLVWSLLRLAMAAAIDAADLRNGVEQALKS